MKAWSKVQGAWSKKMQNANCKLQIANCRDLPGTARDAHSAPQPPAPSPQPRAAMTLIELLAVIVIITTIVAAAIPLISPTNDDRRLREAARGLNTYIIGAQSRAVALRRPVGVAFKRLGADTIKNNPSNTAKTGPDNGMCLEAYYVEQQPPYAGLDVNSRACVAFHPSIPGFVLVRFVTRGGTSANLPIGWAADRFPIDMIHPGDVIEINGTQFELMTLENNVTFDQNSCFRQQDPNRVVVIGARPKNDSGQQINPKYDNQGLVIGEGGTQQPFWTSPAPYKILRQPVAMSDEPYQMPAGTAVDLRASGVGMNDYFYVQDVVDNIQGIVIMFAPEGRVARVGYYQTPPDTDQPFDQAVVDNIYLLVGRNDRIPPEVGSDSTLKIADVNAAKTDEARARLREPINWLSGSSRWIVIGSQSGRVATIENAAVDMASTLNNPPKPFDTALQSTEEMRCAQIIAARELTREMGQLGGR
jgi:type II secretory pathway pseudopilin PulG